LASARKHLSASISHVDILKRLGYKDIFALGCFDIERKVGGTPKFQNRFAINMPSIDEE